MTNFTKWLDTLISEKEFDLDARFTVEGASGTNDMSYQNVVDAIKAAPEHEQAGIKNMLVKIDFANGDIGHFFQHLAQAIAL